MQLCWMCEYYVMLTMADSMADSLYVEYLSYLYWPETFDIGVDNHLQIFNTLYLYFLQYNAFAW